jgi:glycosyltransferase involved in cell wall biosynthesis
MSEVVAMSNAEQQVDQRTVDILLPFYGDVDLMQAAVRSVLAQDDERWLLTVVDDTATSGAEPWFKAVRDDRIRYLKNEKTLGVSGNFNRCLELVQGRLVVFLGSDDLMLSNYVSTVLDLHSQYPDAAAIQAGVQVIDGNGRVVRTLVDVAKRRIYAPRVRGSLTLNGEELAVSLLRGNWMYFPSICWRADIIGDFCFREDLNVVQDLAVMLQIVARGATLVVSDQMIFQYRRHKASESATSARSGARFVEEHNFFLHTANAMDALGWTRAARAARRHVASRLHALSVIPSALCQGKFRLARMLTAHAFRGSSHLTGQPDGDG